MSKIKSPPDFQKLYIKYMKSSELINIISKSINNNTKVHYQNWENIYYKHKNIENANKEWFSIKFFRQQLYRKIDIFENDSFNLIINNAIQQKLHKIDKKAGGNIGVIKEGLLDKGNQNRYLLSSLIKEESISSAQLEGAATTTKVAKKILNEKRKPITKHERMILNNYFLMKEAIKSKDKELSTEMILNFHKIAVQEAIENDTIPGKFRETDDISIIENNTNDILWTPPNYTKIGNYIESLSFFANSDHSNENFIHPIVKAIILHFMIGYIHPFNDGNGRVARAIFYWFMLKSGYWLFEYISISKLLKDSPTKYTKSFQYVETDNNDLTYFIDHQTEVILKAIESLIKYIHKKDDEFTKFTSMIKKSEISNSLKFRQLEILKIIHKSPGKIFTVKDIKNKFSVSENTARKDLKLLTKMGFLVERTVGKNFEFIAVDITDLI